MPPSVSHVRTPAGGDPASAWHTGRQLQVAGEVGEEVGAGFGVDADGAVGADLVMTALGVVRPVVRLRVLVLGRSVPQGQTVT